MDDAHGVTVLRYGHRPGRDDRMTTHVGLTARALGADRVLLPDNAGGPAETIRGVTDRFGGPFAVELRGDGLAVARDWEGTVVHLTMYGRPLPAVESAVRAAHAAGPLLVVVGGEKVPFGFYEAADHNVAVTNQPHSEVASLAVFLDRLFEGRELDRDREWAGARRRVVPQETGKRVVDAGGPDARDAGDARNAGEAAESGETGESGGTDEAGRAGDAKGADDAGATGSGDGR
jgi:tRNA (cytidine56-2'-O)-methyltransferase